jgi:putative integral membrane protein (TIGR02587 family)
MSAPMSDAPASRDIVRAGCGAALFGIPLMYTMEMWWAGSWASPAANTALVLAVLVAATVIDRTAGFRFHADRTWRGSMIDGVEVVAISAVGGLVLLVVIGEIDLSTQWRESLAKVVAQLVPLVIGASIANEILGSGSNDRDSTSEQSNGGNSIQVPHVLGMAGAAMLGAVVIALAIAPTDEVVIIAGRASLGHLLALTAVSLVVSHALVFSADFGRRRRSPANGLLAELGHSGMAYGFAILMSAAMLALYGRLDGVSAMTAWSRVIALGFPASIGAAAGRLAA